MARFPLIDMTGQRFGRLVVVSFAGKQSGHRQWQCRCDCGSSCLVWGDNLRRGSSRSCGCRNAEVVAQRSTTHGKTNSAIYGVWCAMRTRCTNPKARGFESYGGRGIVVCERWRHFENFYADMGDPPTGHSLDRIDNDGNYEPGNCRWASRRGQANNTRRNRQITHQGETLTIAQWAQRIGIRVSTLERRLKLQWPFEKAIKQPVRRMRRR